MLSRLVPLFLTGALFFSGCLKERKQPLKVGELSAFRVLPVETTEALLEPSGLVEWKGLFFTVADKSDNMIYRLEEVDGELHMVEHLQFVPPERGAMDWEGITFGDDNCFYLVSESRGRVARVTSNGKSEWVTPDLRKAAQQDGILRKANAGLEGITFLASNTFLAVLEREPRGIIRYRNAGGIEQIQAGLMLDTPYARELPLLRIPDYSGLDADSGYVYGLFRNAHLVVKIDDTPEGFKESMAWSYQHIETDPKWAYKNQTFGQAEGLVVRDNRVYLIFDNNRGARSSDANDRRSLFVEALMSH